MTNNQKVKKLTKRQWIKSIAWLVGGIILIFVIKWLLYVDSKKTCGNYYREGNMRGAKLFVYHYNVNGVDYRSPTTSMSLKIKTLDSLKQIKCVEIEYSKWFPSISRMIDKRVLKD